jgi:hypothetical protein
MGTRKCAAVGLLGFAVSVGMCGAAQAQDSAAKKSLTVEQIFGSPELNGQLTRGIAWSPESWRLSYLV